MLVQIGKATSEQRLRKRSSYCIHVIVIHLEGSKLLVKNRDYWEANQVWSSMGLGNLALCRTFCEGSHSKYRRMLPVKRDHLDFPPAKHTSTFGAYSFLPGIAGLVVCRGSCTSSSSLSRLTRDPLSKSRSQSWSCLASSPAPCSTGTVQLRERTPATAALLEICLF